LALKQFIQHFLIICGAIILFMGCAQVLPITGGEKDTTPPQILEAKPDNYSTNFSDREIVLKFDEYVKLNQISQEFISSPPLKELPEFIEKGKTVIVRLKDTLLPNTTYNMNFGKGIVDFTEGNPLDSSLFVFSTGSKLDSQIVLGFVVDAFTGEPINGVTAALHSSMADTAPSTIRPDYIAKTNEEGFFQLGYLPPAEFQLHIVDDLNGNYLLDGAVERVGFLPKTIQSTDTITHRIKLFKQVPEKQLITKSKPSSFAEAGMKFDIPVERFSITPINQSKEIGFYNTWNSERDSLSFFVYPERAKDSLTLIVQADSIQDTLIYRMPSYEKYLKAKEKGQSDFQLSFQASTTGGFHTYFDTLFIESNHPLKAIETDSILLVVSGDTLPNDSFQLVNFPLESGKVHAYAPKVAVMYPWQQGGNYQLIYYPGALTDVYGLRHDTLTQSFKTKTFEDYGLLAIHLQEWPNIDLIVELLNDKGKLVKRDIKQDGNSDIAYDLLVPGKYSLRLIVDENGDGKWSTGNLKEKIQPEIVYYFPKPIEVRANWEIDYDWKYSEKL